MLPTYLKMAIRHLGRHKLRAFINVTGLAVGVACCLLIFLYVLDELGYDQFHKNRDRIFRVVNERHAEPTESDPGGLTGTLAWTPPAMGPTMVREFPEVESTARLFILGRTLMKMDDRQLFEPNVYAADPSIFDVFTIPLLQGDRSTALTEPWTAVISQSTAVRIFGEDDPVGKTLVMSGDNQVKITGVFKDLPSRSHLEINVLLSFESVKDMTDPDRLENWIWQQFSTYILLAEGADVSRLELKLPAFIERYADAETKAHGFTYRTKLQPLPDVYLHSAGLRYDIGPRGNIHYLYAFSAIAAFVLLIACFNFMNLSTAHAISRSKEIGLRKAVGAGRGQLVTQFLGESTVLAAVATLGGALLVAAVLPEFNRFAGKSLLMNPIEAPAIPAILVILALTVGLIAGSYPAVFLSRFRPMRVLKASAGVDAEGRPTVRRVLVVLQFAISTGLIAGTLIVSRQVDYLMEKDLGFDSEHVVVLQMRGDVDENIDAVKSELLRHPNIVSASASWGLPGSWSAGDGIQLPGSDTEWSTRILLADYDFIETYRMRMKTGRAFSEEFPSDASRAFILNETAVEDLGWTPEEAIGKEIWWNEWGADSLRKGSVIGVIEDFHSASLYQEIEPLVMLMQPDNAGQLSVRVAPNDISETLDHIESTVKTWAPAWPFEFEFLEEDLTEEYVTEQKLWTLVGIFSGLAILIACLGLFGLTLFTAERRTREIGIRKVLGASVESIVLLLSSEFVRLVAISFFIGVPLAWLALREWLDNFAYHIEFGVGAFAAAGFAVLAIALLTVGYQAVRAAMVDPVKSLRYE